MAELSVDLPGIGMVTFMELRKIENARALLKKTYEIDGESYDLDLLAASIEGLETDYQLARTKLEALTVYILQSRRSWVS